MKVKYNNPETGELETKDCVNFKYNSFNPVKFEFMPVDNPIKIYKSVIIYHPLVEIIQYNQNFNMVVEGYQYIKGEYRPTQTTFYNG